MHEFFNFLSESRYFGFGLITLVFGVTVLLQAAYESGRKWARRAQYALAVLFVAYIIWIWTLLR